LRNQYLQREKPFQISNLKRLFCFNKLNILVCIFYYHKDSQRKKEAQRYLTRSDGLRLTGIKTSL
jgi:hypothetical protein